MESSQDSSIDGSSSKSEVPWIQNNIFKKVKKGISTIYNKSSNINNQNINDKKRRITVKRANTIRVM